MQTATQKMTGKNTARARLLAAIYGTMMATPADLRALGQLDLPGLIRVSLKSGLLDKRQVAQLLKP